MGADFSSFSTDQIEDKFGYHKANDETIELHRETRKLFRSFVEALDELVPGDGVAARQKAVMITELESASMWAHKAISSHAPVVPE